MEEERDVPVEVEEEHDKVEGELAKGLLLIVLAGFHDSDIGY